MKYVYLLVLELGSLYRTKLSCKQILWLQRFLTNITNSFVFSFYDNLSFPWLFESKSFLIYVILSKVDHLLHLQRCRYLIPCPCLSDYQKILLYHDQQEFSEPSNRSLHWLIDTHCIDFHYFRIATTYKWNRCTDNNKSLWAY